MLFECFLNPERISMPDIDIDFPIREEMKSFLCKRQNTETCMWRKLSRLEPLQQKVPFKRCRTCDGIDSKAKDRLAKLDSIKARNDAERSAHCIS
ncbi:hypothetical protein ACEQPO_21755 [Bacillus sp. SL00103]